MTFQRTRARRRRSVRIFRRLALVTLVCCRAKQGPAGSLASAAPGSRRNLPRLAPVAGAHGATSGESGRASADGDAAHHAVPIVVAAAQIIGTGGARGEKDVLAFAGLHHDFGVFAIEDFRIVEL